MKPVGNNMSGSFSITRKSWLILALLPTLLCLLPLFFIFYSIFEFNYAELIDAFDYFSISSVTNTFILIVGVLFVSLIIGVGLGYLFAHYNFFGSKVFETLFMLPIAIPGYIMAVAYSSFFEYGGTFYQYTGFYFSMMNMTGLILVLSFTLYPYIYINALHAFRLSSSNFSESGYALGASRTKVFIKIIFPLILPSVVAGAGLCMLETLNDFGASSYYGIRTVSNEIYRCWQVAPSLTVFLSLLVLLVIFILVVFYTFRIRKRQFFQAAKSKPIVQKKLGKNNFIFIFILCTTLFLIVFLLPVAVLVHYTFRTGVNIDLSTLMVRSYNSFYIATVAALIILVFCIITSFGKIVNHSKSKNYFSILADFGYAVPGAALAVALISVSVFFDNYLPFAITGSFAFLVVAYFIRFYAAGRQPVESYFKRLSPNLFSASGTLGKKPFFTLRKIYWPILFPAFISIFLLVLIDVLKELPLTLILKPFNFETLSTSVYGYAKVNENVSQAAPYSILIITLGVIAMLMLRRVEKKYGIAKS